MALPTKKKEPAFTKVPVQNQSPVAQELTMDLTAWPERFSRFVDHYSTRTEASPQTETPPDFIRVIDSDIGRSVGFNRIAVHHIVLPPGCRTSSPHAESLEEEFVFVLKGKPHLWLNGYIHELDEHFAVGFPAGTGIAHTFINNTDQDIYLIVAGDRSKKENLCSFPINPELKESCKIWWNNPPIHPLGPHNGLPGPVKEFERAKEPSPYILNCKAQGRRKLFHYPGDSETFGEGIRITDHIGLKNLGICYEYLPPGARSAYPHAHTHEEEFAFILKGHPAVWLDGFSKTMAPNEFAAFPSNTGLAHVLINDTDEEVVYLGIGETAEFPDEKISYPLNPLRQKECRRKGWYWEDLKTSVAGSHPAKSNKNKIEHFEFQLCNEAQALEVFKTSPTYFERVDGCPPSLQTARHALVDLPQKRGKDSFKECLVIKLNGQPIGFLELHANHPEKEICYLGLLLISDDLCSRGLGRKCFALAQDYIFRALRCKKVRVGISDDNDVQGFWQKMGFVFNGKTSEWEGQKKTATVREFDKDLNVKGL